MTTYTNPISHHTWTTIAIICISYFRYWIVNPLL